MKYHTLTAEQITAYTQFLYREERADATVEKYSRNVLPLSRGLGTLR